MSNNERRGASVCVDILKATRASWLTADEIGDEVGTSYRATRTWTEELTAQGVLKQREREKPIHRPGVAPREYRLASQWGGL